MPIKFQNFNFHLRSLSQGPCHLMADCYIPGIDTCLCTSVHFTCRHRQTVYIVGSNCKTACPRQPQEQDILPSSQFSDIAVHLLFPVSNHSLVDSDFQDQLEDFFSKWPLGSLLVVNVSGGSPCSVATDEIQFLPFVNRTGCRSSANDQYLMMLGFLLIAEKQMSRVRYVILVSLSRWRPTQRKHILHLGTDFAFPNKRTDSVASSESLASFRANGRC